TQPVGTEDERDLVARMLVGGLQAVDASDTSMLSLLLHLRSGGGVGSLTGMDGNGRRDRVVGGPAEIARRLAGVVGEPRVRLGHRVRTVERMAGGRMRVWSDRARFESEAVIVAVTAALVGEIEFRPELPVVKQQALRKVLPGVALKMHLVFAAPFW